MPSVMQNIKPSRIAVSAIVTVAMTIAAPFAVAHSSDDAASTKRVIIAWASDQDESVEVTRERFAGNLEGDSVAPIQLASNEYDDHRDRKDSKRPEVSRSPEVRGHEQKIEVIRRSARPIPRTHYSTKNKSHRSGRSHHYYSNHYNHGHVHHSHCGHSYWEYGDAYESRTLGRSCMYGTNGEVIYKPADVICAPDEAAAPEQDLSAPPTRSKSPKPASKPAR